MPYRILTILLTASGFVVFDFHARMVFIARAYRRRYGHGKTWNRARKHYKKNWTFWQRMLWVPVFKESYEFEVKFLVAFSYIQAFLGFLSIILLYVNEFIITNFSFWHYAFLVYAIVSFVRYAYDDLYATGKL